MKKHRFTIFVAAISLLLILILLQPKNGTPLLAADKLQEEISQTITLPSFAELAKKLAPVTVNISTTKIIKAGRDFRHYGTPFGRQDPFRDFFGDDFMRRFFGDTPRRDFKQKSLGSGFIIDKDGFILTNNHVVEGADEIKVKLATEQEYDAKVIGRDKKTDLALIQIKELNEDLPVASLGDSDNLQVGEWVMAMGNPFGLQGTVTVGIVSAKWRKIGAGPYDDFIQTDASINPGNSGGPLFNTKGEVVGINTAIYTPSGGNIGIGFATPINIAKNIILQLREKGRVVRGWLGVVVQTVTPELAESFNIKEGKGALVADVEEDGPAAEAGLKSGDVIVTFDGKEVEEMSDLPLMVAETEVGKKVRVVVVRDGKKKSFTVKIGELEEKEQEVLAKAEGKDVGMSVKEITPEMASRYGLSEEEGIIITNIEPGSPADEAGLMQGDIIKEINKQAITTMQQYLKAMDKTESDESILLLIKRGRNSIWVVLKP